MIDLRAFKWTLPVGGPDEVFPIGHFEDAPWFVQEADYVRCRAHAGGATTSGSHYARSEGREMDGDRKASWSTTRGRHKMIIDFRLTRLPDSEAGVVGQIHNADDDVAMIRLESIPGTDWARLYLEQSLGKGNGSISHHLGRCQLGSRHQVKLRARRGRVIARHGLKRRSFARSTTGCYFKFGIYIQFNTRTQPASAYAEVEHYQPIVSHS